MSIIVIPNERKEVIMITIWFLKCYLSLDFL